MFSTHAVTAWYFWHLVTRLGEAQLVLPLALAIAASRARDPQARPGAFRWIALLVAAMLVTAVSKVAFIGWGIGSAALNFTGISGHTMFAAALYPPLLWAIASGTTARAQRLAIVAGSVLALLVGVSRVVLGAHSVSEVLAGWLAGGLVALGILGTGIPIPARLNVAMIALAVLWITLMPATAPTLNTHSLVTRVALKLSGHQRPYTRHALLNGNA